MPRTRQSFGLLDLLPVERINKVEAERAVLGAAVLFPECRGDVLHLLATTDFFNPSHQHFFDGLRDLDAKAPPVTDDATMLTVLNGHVPPAEVSSIIAAGCCPCSV